MSAPAIPCPPHRRGPRLAQGGGLLRVALAGMLILAGCTDFPDMTGRLTDADTGQGYPALVPAEDLLAGTQEQVIAPDTQTSLEDRVAALERRATALRATTFDAETRDRMETGVTAEQP